MNPEEIRNYMGYQWLCMDEDELLIGINEQGVNEITEIHSIEFPSENQEVVADEICAHIETDDGHLDIYSPVDGIVTEINSEVSDNHELILEDPMGEGWLFKIQPHDSDDLDDMDENDDDDDDEEEE